MANPVSIECLANIWTLVASNVTAGQVKRLDKRPGAYLETYRMTGGAAPTEQREGVPCFAGTDSAVIEAANAIDVYIMAVGSDGWVRVDVP